MPDQIGGNLRSPRELPHERLLEAAKQIYLWRGYIPLDLAAELLASGCIVEELEKRWKLEGRDAP